MHFISHGQPDIYLSGISIPVFKYLEQPSIQKVWLGDIEKVSQSSFATFILLRYVTGKIKNTQM